MMRRAGKIALWSILFCGCAGRYGGPRLRAAQVAAAPAPARVANLVLGPSGEHALMAELFVGRWSLPGVAIGYRLDDTSLHTEVTYDDEAFFDRLGGGYFRAGQSVRTGVLLR